MITKIQKFAIGAGSAIGLLAPLQMFAAGFVSDGDADIIVAGFVDDVGDILLTSLPVVLAVAAALVGVYLLIRFARRTVK